MKASEHPKCDVFTTTRFRNWKKVNNKKEYAFLNHIGEDHYLNYDNTVNSYDDL